MAKVEIGDVVKHRLTGERCMIIRQGKEQVLVRTMDYKEVWVYLHELILNDDKT